MRHFGALARIEVPVDQISDLKANFRTIEKSIKALGFESCEIDEEGLISGKLNRTLNIENGRAV